MAKQYPLDVKNVGDDTYMVMTKGHHCPLEFMKAVRIAGYDWPLGKPEHIWLKAVPNNQDGGSYYHRVSKNTVGAFPATFSSEEYGDEQYSEMVQWTGENLREVIAFTGKSKRFDEWFPTWQDYEQHVKAEGNTFKIIKEFGNEIAQVGDWIYRTNTGANCILNI